MDPKDKDRSLLDAPSGPFAEEPPPQQREAPSLVKRAPAGRSEPSPEFPAQEVPDPLHTLDDDRVVVESRGVDTGEGDVVWKKAVEGIRPAVVGQESPGPAVLVEPPSPPKTRHLPLPRRFSAHRVRPHRWRNWWRKRWPIFAYLVIALLATAATIFAIWKI